MARLGRMFMAAAIAGLVCAACGSRTGLALAVGGEPEGTLPDGGETLPPDCGDGRCATGETCQNCSVDCGLCPGCGDNQCLSSESCSSCPQDCGACDACGDGFCKGNETCLTCAPDCGNCPGCGDGKCDGKTEDCFTCPDDCGKCKGCGDGQCGGPETCASCVSDCGVCGVCGNMKCEAPYETCSNCHADCGDCETIGCLAMLTCAFKCIDTSSMPPAVRISCVGDCVAIGCPAARSLFDQAFNCFIQHIGDCGASFSCLTNECSSEVAACVGATCD